MLKAHITQGDRPTLEQLDVVRGKRSSPSYLALLFVIYSTASMLIYVQGDEIGSCMIDIDFQDFVIRRLKPIQQHMTKSADDAAWEMTKDRFQDQKMEFGTEDSDLQNRKTIRVPGLPGDFTLESAGIRRERLAYTK